LKAFKTRIYPTSEQAILIDKTIGCCRFVYNNGLALKKELYEKDKTHISAYDLIKKLVKQKQEFEWLKEVEAQSLQQSLIDLDSAYKKFFREKKGFPNFHKKGQKDSYRTLSAKKESKHYIKLPKIGKVKVAEPLKKKWNIGNATISKRADKYFISLLVDFTAPKIQKAGEVVGIDVGIKTFATLSDGVVIENIKTTKKYADKLAHLQRILSKTEKGSNNRNKAKLAVARLHLKISNTRKDFLHKASSVITKQYSLVALENLNVNGMLKNHKLAKSIADCSWTEFARQLEYKGEWYGCEIKKIGRFEPSSKLCSVCGYKMDKMPLNIRKWTCPHCNTQHDRDLNASVNILKIALSGREEEPVDTRHNSVVEQENLKVANS
jgi:putative transposase